MRNFTRTNRNRIINARKHPDITAVARRGYMDARGGKGFAPDYETLPKHNQNNYEFGRLWAVYLGGTQAPNWPAQTILPRFVDAIRETVKRDLRAYEGKEV